MTPKSPLRIEEELLAKAEAQSQAQTQTSTSSSSTNPSLGKSGPAPGSSTESAAEINLEDRQRMAETLWVRLWPEAPPIQWTEGGIKGICQCPNIDNHSGHSSTECVLWINGDFKGKWPTLKCAHSGCQDDKQIKRFNHELRGEIRKAHYKAKYWQGGETDRAGIVVLPSGDVTISQCAAEIFKRIAPTHTMFYRGGGGGGVVVELSYDKDGNAYLEPLKAKAFRTRVERHCTLMAWRAGKGNELVLKPSKMAVDDAEAILASLEARELLPPISSVLRCAVLTEREGQLVVLNKGYHPEMGGILITQAEKVPDVPLDEAVGMLLDLVGQFEFQTEGDRSRNLAARITPALRMGGFLRRSVPLDVMEADQSQAGKGYSHCITTAFYNETPYPVAQRKGGVGSMDESFATALVSGRPFIALDNIRDRLDSPYFESFLTSPGLFPARIPGGLTVMIDPRQTMLQLTSNGMESTKDLANRASICRINKRSNFQYDDLPAIIREAQAAVLGCVFAVIREWHRRGKPKTNEMRHDFHDWCQTLDWIVQHILGCAPLMDGHQEAQKRVSSPVLSWLRNVALELERQGQLDKPITASNLVTTCMVAGIELPYRMKVDEKTARQMVGGTMHREFKGSDRIVLEGFCIERDETEYRKPSGDLDTANAYRFTRITKDQAQ